MTSPTTPSNPPGLMNRATEVTIRLALIALMAIWCLQIVQPFVVPVLWGVIIATAVYPAFVWLQKKLGGRAGLTALVLVLVGLAVLIAPTAMSAASFVESAKWLSDGLSDGSLEIPPPPEAIAAWPIVGDGFYDIWLLASTNLKAALERVGPELAPLASGALSATAGLFMGLLQFIIAICIAGVLLAHSTASAAAARQVASRLAHERGPEFVVLASNTIRGVTQGILGVALIQSALIAVGLFAIGIPHASLWVGICLLFAVVQLPPTIVLIPIIIYVFSAYPTAPAVLFAIWSTLASLSDNVLKPILLARGLDLPMAVIFMGAIGGFVMLGFIGLFVGAVTLALGYTLFMAWLGDAPADGEDAEPASG
jgi:predicted PurR-regulated permease PerM